MGGGDCREEHGLKSRGSCLNECRDSFHSFLQILIDRGDEDDSVVDSNSREGDESDPKWHRELIPCEDESDHHEWE